jgi:hypothetical protein
MHLVSKWTTQMGPITKERELSRKFLAGKSVFEISNEMGRQPSAIVGRLKKFSLVDKSFDYTNFDTDCCK